MKEKKKIDRVFQERFKNFEAHPPDEIWVNIEKRLNKKKERRVIPLWFKLSGAAAILLLLFFVGDIYFSTSVNNSTRPNAPGVTNNNANSSNDQDKAQDEAGTNELNASEKEKIVNSDKPENALKPAENGAKTVKKGSKTSDPSVKVVTASTSEENNIKEQKENNRDLDDAIAEQGKDEKSENNATSKSEDQKENYVPNFNRPKIESTVATVDSISNTIESTGNSERLVSNKSENDSQEKVDEQSLEEIVKEEQIANNAGEESTDIDENSSKRWAVTPTVAPVYYNSFSGSGIDPEFDNNSKDGGVNLSYGVLLSYAVNNKLTLRSGLNRINLSYNTNDALLSPGFQAGAIQNQNSAFKNDVVRVASAVRSADESALPSAVEVSSAVIEQGFVSQSLSYFEIPMEMEYALLENRVGVTVIGGLSTLLLNDNALTFNDSDFTTSLPESTNLNDVSFSTNVGLGFNYKFTKEIKFNLEPMFKYQLNAYKNNVSDFRPYYLGLYTGFSIKF
ncbi:MAG: outer membrane beta-barrel protein [Leeuwenhoekiella sp.]